MVKKCINKVLISGEIIDSKPKFSHMQNNIAFYQLRISIRRKSYVDDIIPVIFAKDMLDISGNYKGCSVNIEGIYYSRNKRISKNRSKLILQVLADKIEFENNPHYFGENSIELEGTVCKPPVYRETPYGKEITDVFVASNDGKGESNYIPCICWGTAARYAGALEVGDRVYLYGKIQSREYHKNGVSKIAYEVSAKRIEEIKDEEN